MRAALVGGDTDGDGDASFNGYVFVRIFRCCCTHTHPPAHPPTHARAHARTHTDGRFQG